MIKNGSNIKDNLDVAKKKDLDNYGLMMGLSTRGNSEMICLGVRAVSLVKMDR
jgi:hypothetical protein